MDGKNFLKQKLRHLFPRRTFIHLDDFSFFSFKYLFLFVKSLMKFDTLDDGCSFPASVYLAMV